MQHNQTNHRGARGLAGVAAVVAVGALTLVGCTPPGVVQDTPRPPVRSLPPASTLCVALVDISGSTRDPRVRASYVADLARLAHYCAEHDGHVLLDAIDGNVRANPVQPVRLDVRPTRRENSFVCRGSMASRVRAAIAAARKLAGTPPVTPGSDVFGALSAAGEAFRAHRGHGQRVLLVLSDALATRGSSLYRRGLPERTASTLQRMRQRGELRGFEGVQAYFAGAGIGAPLDPHELVELEKFWRAWAAASGATLRSYGRQLALPEPSKETCEP